MASLKQRFAPFWRNTAGNTAILFALAVVPIFLAVGASVDFARYYATQTQLQAALDAGALAGAAMLTGTDGERKATALAAFKSNLSGEAEGDATFTIVDGKFVAEASAEMNTSFMVLAGINAMDLAASAEVGMASNKKAEVALVLDYSGSMGEVSGTKVKYIAMRNAAKLLVDDLSAANPDKVKFGLVPFSHHVYTTLPSAYVLGAAGANWTGCTQDRQFPHNRKDSTPTAANKTKWGQPMAPEHAAWGCAGYVSNNLVMKPLTDDFASLNSQLNAMKPYAWTHIALGVEFGYHLLSPNAPFSEGVSYSNTDTRKFMIVLTDGMQTEPAFGPGTTRTVAQGESNLEDLCTNAKADGITIITLAFDLDDTTTRQRLKNCSTNPATDFFVATDDTDLMAAFESIKLAISSEIFLSK